MSGNKIEEVNEIVSKKLLQNLYEQRSEKSFCDIILTVQGCEIWCHACVLASCSYYFKELLQVNCTLKSHWCFCNPLEINICKVMEQYVDLCSSCVMNIIDSMYLKELVVVKEHLEHFSTIVKFFKVVDLFPLCGNYSKIGKELQEGTKQVKPSEDTPTKKKSFVIKESCTGVPGKNSEIEEYENVQIQKSLVKETTNEYTNCSFEDAVIGGDQPMSSSGKISADHNYVIREPVKNQKCEFICCNSFETSISTDGEFQSEKRVLRCEVCTLSTVSVRKMLKHIENSKHYGNMCSICYLKFTSNDLVRDHLKDHFDVKPFVCHICMKRNRIWEYHKLHYKVHCKNKAFSCSICEKSFKHKSTLYVHMKVHKQINSPEINNLTDGSDVKKYKSRGMVVTNTSNELVHSNKVNVSEKKSYRCQLCNEGFTQKKNLTRHSHLKHWTNDFLKCSGCNYKTKRSDLLKHHIRKYHKELVVEEALKQKPKLKKQYIQDKSPIVGVMIPVQLISTTDSLALNGFVVEKNEEATRQFQNEQNYLDAKTNPSNTICINKIQDSSCQQDISEKHHRITNDTATVQLDCSSLLLGEQLLTSSTIENIISQKDSEKSRTLNTEDLKSDIKANSDRYEMADSMAKCSNENFEQIDNSSTSTFSGIWLNEATGELLNENHFLNVRLVDPSRLENKCQTTENSILDIKTPLQALILNEMSNGIPLLDFGDDADNFQSNPQTPQTSMVEIEDADNLFSWNYLEANFCSTWVLNEATGELNMVSFNMQSFKDSESLKLEENTGRPSMDDDETALFLNEGTGDLSVIYFNPNKCDHKIADYPMELTNQEDQDNMSEHSNDDRDDLLNEEFLIASANFMAYEENETFLNELTGEFDTTALSQYQSGKEEKQPENVYLNEETGEISWNVLDKNIGRHFFTNSENLNFDFDESLNYEDFDITEDINDFQFQSSFGLDTNISSDWHDDPCGTLLNECTGEFVTKK